MVTTILVGGHDLHVNGTLSGGYANLGHSFGDRGSYSQTSYHQEFTGTYNAWAVGDYETFTLSASTGNFGSGASSLVDEQGNAVVSADVPVSFGLGALALAGLLGFRRKATQ